MRFRRSSEPNRWLMPVLGCLAMLTAPAVLAEETIGKWRIELTLGGTDPGDSITSQSANVQTLDFSDIGSSAVVGNSDPRPNLASTIQARLSTDTRFDLRASYGLKAFKTTELLLDFGLGYYAAHINNLEFFYSFDVEDGNYATVVPDQHVDGCEANGGVNPCLPFSLDVPLFGQLIENWHYEGINGGDLKFVPISAGVMARFRSGKRFNPYVGFGLGYLKVDLTKSKRWEEIADQLTGSLVDDAIKGPGPFAGELDRVLAGRVHEFKRPEISAPSTYFFETKGGVEWQLQPKVAIFANLGFFWAADGIKITMDGKEQLGRATPSVRVGSQDPAAAPAAGMPAYIMQGGLSKTLRDRNGDLIGTGPWPGEYFFNGGTLDYGGFNFTAGVRISLK